MGVLGGCGASSKAPADAMTTGVGRRQTTVSEALDAAPATLAKTPFVVELADRWVSRAPSPRGGPSVSGLRRCNYFELHEEPGGAPLTMLGAYPWRSVAAHKSLIWIILPFTTPLPDDACMAARGWAASPANALLDTAPLTTDHPHNRRAVGNCPPLDSGDDAEGSWPTSVRSTQDHLTPRRRPFAPRSGGSSAAQASPMRRCFDGCSSTSSSTR